MTGPIRVSIALSESVSLFVGFSGTFSAPFLCTVPLDVKHFVFWTRVPIIHPAIVSPKIWKKVEIDGLWGFTGGAPESVANISQEVSGAEESDDVEALIKQARFQTNEYVKANWREDEWETAWFVNPPVSELPKR